MLKWFWDQFIPEWQNHCAPHQQSKESIDWSMASQGSYSGLAAHLPYVVILPEKIIRALRSFDVTFYGIPLPIQSKTVCLTMMQSLRLWGVFFLSYFHSSLSKPNGLVASYRTPPLASITLVVNEDLTVAGEPSLLKFYSWGVGIARRPLSLSFALTPRCPIRSFPSSFGCGWPKNDVLKGILC